jgi:hypothetical protein
MSTRPGVFEVARVYRGMGMQLVDILNGERFEVFDVSASRSLHPWDVIWARLVRTGEDYGMEGVCLVFSHGDKPHVMRALEEVLGAGGGRTPTAEQYSRKYHSLDRRLRSLLADRRVRLVTREGEEVRVCRAHYVLEDPRVVAKKLQPLPSLWLAGEDEKDPEVLVWNWAVPPKDVPRGEPPAFPPEDKVLQVETRLIEVRGRRRGRRLLNLGMVRVGPDAMELECLSEGRLRRLREMVEGALGDAVRIQRIVVEDLEDLERTSGKTEEGESDTLLEFEGIQRELAEEFVQEWMERPLPALGGLTPSAAAKSEEGLERLQEILKDLVNAASRGHSTYLRMEQVEELARRLGVEPPA